MSSTWGETRAFKQEQDAGCCGGCRKGFPLGERRRLLNKRRDQVLRASPPQWEESLVNWSVVTPFYSQVSPSTESLHTREFCTKTIRYSLWEAKALTPLPGGDCGPMTDWAVIQNRVICHYFSSRRSEEGRQQANRSRQVASFFWHVQAGECRLHFDTRLTSIDSSVNARGNTTALPANRAIAIQKPVAAQKTREAIQER